MVELAAYVCSHVFENSRPVLLVTRSQGDWQYLCGGEHATGEVPHVVGLNHLLQRDPTLADLKGLPDDWEAERASVGAAWTKTRANPDA